MVLSASGYSQSRKSWLPKFWIASWVVKPLKMIHRIDCLNFVRELIDSYRRGWLGLPPFVVP